jgi:hypothetical protein
LIALPPHLRLALYHLGEEPTVAAVTWDLIRELIMRGLIEWHNGGIHFTNAGHELFQELRGMRNEMTPRLSVANLPSRRLLRCGVHWLVVEDASFSKDSENRATP